MNSTVASTEMSGINTKHDAFYVIRRKSDGRFWHTTINPDYDFDYVSFEIDPLGADRIDSNHEEEIQDHIEWVTTDYEKTFDPNDFEIVKVAVSYTLSVESAVDAQTGSAP
jgi:hypothetical protein